MKHFYIWALLFISTIAMAQQDLTVSVIDAATQKPIASSTVILQNKSRNIQVSITSNTQGKVVFRNLEALDGYQVISEETTEYAAATSDLISIRSNQNPNATLVLQKTLPSNWMKL